jgi:Zn-dependent peptidase ImmA (M78 family)
VRKKLFDMNKPREWNIRVLTEDHLYDYCNTAGITISEADIDPQPGLYVPETKQIILSDQIRGAMRVWVGFHEYGHHLMHAPGTQCFLGYKSRIEEEAETFAACALMPRTILPPKFAWSEIRDLYGYEDWMMIYRTIVRRKWEI